MAKLSLRHIYKVYSNGCKAVNDFSMEIDDKEFIVFVGPSGCGKSTTLRMIAGLEEISAGELYIDDVLVNDMEPKDRDISMVFQNYALYPHMTVYDNMAFGLKLMHVPQEEIHKKVLWAAQVLKLTDYLDRKPRAMSGGQRQRVALGRAILRNPKVFLLDEPLSNLDAKLRTEMRAEITKLYQKLGTTFIYVTHDQVEAMTLGTRVVVMKLGYVQQIDTPQNLYNYPTNKFVAGFIGTPQMNFFDAKLIRKGNDVNVNFVDCDTTFNVDFNNLIKVRPSYLRGNKTVIVGIRSENISIDEEVVKKSKNVVKVKVNNFEELGSETLIYGDLKIDSDVFEDTTTGVVIRARNKGNLKSGDIVEAAFDMSKAHFFDKVSEESIAPRIPNEVVFDSDIKDGSIDLLGNKIVLPPAMRVEDTSGVELLVPTDSISFNGNIDAKVVDVEVINGQQLVHLQIKDRVFFAKSEEKVNVGETVKIGFDIRRIQIYKDDTLLVDSLQTRNKLIGVYTNSQNNAKSLKTIKQYYKDKAAHEIKVINHEKNIELGELGLNDTVIKEYKMEFEQKKNDAQAEMNLAIGTYDFGKEGKKRAQAEYNKKIAQYKAELQEIIVKYKALCESAKNDGSLKGKEEEINNMYQPRIDNVNAILNDRIKEFDDSKNIGNDIFIKAENEDKATFTAELEELDNKHDSEVIKMNELISSTQDIEKAKEYKQQLKDLNNRYMIQKNDLISKSKTFFININGHYVKSSPLITKKIVQALGIGIFNVNYRFEIGLESIKISNAGFKAKVSNVLDYGEDKYVVAYAHNEKIVIKADKEYKPNDEIFVDFDIKDIHVFENKFNIRLY